MSTETIRTTCSYCSVGCNFNVTLKDGQVQNLMPDKEYPVNLGKSCPKGFHLLKPFEAPDRATSPMMRNDQGELESVSWNTALNSFVEQFRAIKEKHGPEAAAFLSTGQMPTEEMALLGSLWKFGMGFVHADGNTRQCMATAAVAYKQSFGFDAPPFTYEDFEESDLMIFVGANPVVSHPIMWNRVQMNRQDAEIVVIDPRETKTAKAATEHMPVYPKTDLRLLYCIANILIQNGWIDRDYIDAHTEGFEEFKNHVAVRTAQAIINICLITGNIGRPGTGPNSITGQANAMGSRIFSNTTSLLGGFDFAKEKHRQTVADRLGIGVENIPSQNSLPYHKILEKVEAGEIKGLWIIATNPAHSWIGKSSFFETMKKLDFLVVQDLYTSTETAQVCDLLLPAAGSGEKDGIFINSERRIGAVRKVMDPPAEARSDFDILKGIADTWGCAEMFSEWSSPEDAFKVLQRVSEGQPCDITGIGGYQTLLDKGGVQWPYPKGAEPEGTNRRLFEDGQFYTENGRAKLLFDPIRELPEQLSDQYPMILLTGRGTVVQWHTQTRTGKVDMLKKLYPEEAYIELNPEDAERLSVSDGDEVRVISRRAETSAKAKVTDQVKSGAVFMPMHYRETNWLTIPAFDPYSHEPAYKWAAVRVEPAQ
jgi:assimilatory nitrate reductase catalytic subunit